MSKDIKSMVVASRFFDDGVELSSITSADVPGITLDAADIKGSGVMGTLNLPATGQIGSMEYVVHSRGVEADTDRLSRPGTHVQEMRYAQDTYNTNTGTITQEKVKLIVTGVFKSSDGGRIEPGAAVESSATYEVMRMQKFVAGKETLLIDKVKQIFKINGTDHWEKIRSALA